MRIVHIAAEFAPIAKAGGMGEVLLGLTKELSQTGFDVETIIPKYDFIDTSKLTDLRIEVPDFKCLGNPNAMWFSRYENATVKLLEARHPAGYFHRGSIYGFEDDVARFGYFCRAALEYLSLENKPIDILHLHDWHAALCAPMVKEIFKTLKVKAIVLSLHNMEYQGRCAPFDLDRLGLNGEDYLDETKMQDDDPLFSDALNLLKGGIVYADAIVPVSPTYAKEILTPAAGFKLEKTLKKHKDKITGILNGIDQKTWDPETDAHLTAQYGAEGALKGKEQNRNRFKADQAARPWIGAITRLVPQKGPELLEEALKKTVELGGTFFLLGSSPILELQQKFDELKVRYKGNKQVMLHYEYNEGLAHRLYAALDFLIVPSIFEPCGLTQLIAMRYGTIPIVRSTGGLKDTVFDFEDITVAADKRNGFTFGPATKAATAAVIARAVKLFQTDSASIRSLIRRGMQSDFSWKLPAQQYLRLYRKLREKSDANQTVSFSADWLKSKLQMPLP